MDSTDISESFLNQVALQRQNRLRATMIALDVPALLILDPVNILYATGVSNMTVFSMRTASRYLLMFAEGPAVLFEYTGCEHLAANRKTIDDIRPARGLCHVSSNGNPASQAVALADDVARVLTDLGCKPQRLAVDRFPYPVIDALRDVGFCLTDADAVFSSVRKVKVPDEIRLLREALNRVAGAVSALAEGIEPGRTETEIWSDFSRTFIASEGRYVTTRLLQGGARTFPYFQEARSYPVHAGDLLCFDTDAVGYAGYCVDLSRTYLCGDVPATPDQLNLHQKAREQLEHNIDLIKPGAAYAEVAQAAWPVPAEHRSSRYYCIAHGLGMSGEFPNITYPSPGEPSTLDGVIEPGMILCVESYIGCQRTNQGVKLEEQLLIGESGVDRMSSIVPFDTRLE